MTGAIVRRQPFGGWKRSRVGATSKAGGPLYVAQFRAWTSEGFDADADAESYAQWWAAIGCQDSDPTGLRAESNRYRLRPLPGPVMVRIGSQAPSEWTAIARAAAKVTGVEIVESCEDAETEAECLARMQGLRPTHLRLLGKAGPDIWRGAHELETVVDDRPPVTCAALELPRWTHEQVVSVTMHRHGHIDESRLARDRRALA